MLDTVGTILDIIQKNHDIQFEELMTKYRSRYHIEEWQDDPFKESVIMNMLIHRQKITSSDGKYTITDSGRKHVKDQKDRQKKRNIQTNFKNFFKYIFTPVLAIVAVIISSL